MSGPWNPTAPPDPTKPISVGAYKLVYTWHDDEAMIAAELKLNKLANQGWQIIACTATRHHFCWTLERKPLERGYRDTPTGRE